MTRAPKPTRPVVGTTLSAPDTDRAEIVQVKVWLLDINPMMWRRVLVASTCILGELHGVIQAASALGNTPTPTQLRYPRVNAATLLAVAGGPDFLVLSK